MKCPLKYRNCTQTVTVYRRTDGTITRKVYNRAFYDFHKTETVNKIGSTEDNGFLLVIPGESTELFPGDKVFLGTGPIVEEIDWASFIPSKVAGLVVIKYVDPKYWRGVHVHTEAGA